MLVLIVVSDLGALICLWACGLMQVLGVWGLVVGGFCGLMLLFDFCL